MRDLTMHLWFNGNCAEVLEFYEKAFGAKSLFPPMTGPGGKRVLHAMMQIGDTNFMMADASPGQWGSGPKEEATAGLFLYDEVCDALVNQAADAGCETLAPPEDMFWGDRMAKVKDPFGHCWSIATHQWVYTPEEMQKNQEAWLASMSS